MIPDGTQERTLDAPDDTLSDAEIRACEDAARDDWDRGGETVADWLDDTLADTPEEAAAVVRCAVDLMRGPRDPREGFAIEAAVAALRDRFAAECAGDYADRLEGDPDDPGRAIDAAEYQEER